MAAQKVKGKHSGNGANTRYTERRRNRRTTNVRDRINALIKIPQGQRTSKQRHTLRRLQNFLDHPRQRAHSYSRPNTRGTVARRFAATQNVHYVHDEHGNRVSGPRIVRAVKTNRSGGLNRNEDITRLQIERVLR